MPVQEWTHKTASCESYLRIEPSMVNDKPEEAVDRILRIIGERGFISISLGSD
jgi:hypothetical protein